jgi:hypothetical protein
MSQPPIRLLHASDLHLERPVAGLTEVPAHLADRLIDAPICAARNLFDAAIREAVDLVILAGDVIDVGAAGPRGLAFLLGELDRLAAHGIAVVWVAGKVDRATLWPQRLTLPERVRRFDAPDAVPATLNLRSGASVRIVARAGDPRGRIPSRPFRFARDQLPTIGVAYGRAHSAALLSCGLDYWALGGLHRRTTLASSPTTIHYPGTTQARAWHQCGPHGVALVDLTAEGPKLRMLPTDVVRWVTESIEAGHFATDESLRQKLLAALDQCWLRAAGRDLLVRLSVVGGGPAAERLATADAHARTLAWLRDEFGRAAPTTWVASIDIAPRMAEDQAAIDDDTLLGEFQRGVLALESSPDAPLGLEHFLPPATQREPWHESLAVRDPLVRSRLLAEVAALGDGLLRPEGHRS